MAQVNKERKGDELTERNGDGSDREHDSFDSRRI